MSDRKRSQVVWSEDEDSFIQLGSSISSKKIAALVNRKTSVVRQKLTREKIKFSKNSLKNNNVDLVTIEEQADGTYIITISKEVKGSISLLVV